MSEEPYFQILFFILGALLGSFANVVILRLPRGENIALPRSRCSSCQKVIAWYDNIPIFSWFILMGKCRNCKSKYSFRYALVEILTALLFAFAYSRAGLSFLLVEYLIFILGLVIITFIDIDTFTIPDSLSLSGIVLGLLGSILNPHRTFLDSFFGVLLGGGFLWLIAYIYEVMRKEEGMGGGDIKLLAWVGAVLGWKSIPFVILVSSISGSLIGVFLIFSQKGGLKTAIPFGPYLALGAVIYLLGGDQIASWYLRLFFPDLT